MVKSSKAPQPQPLIKRLASYLGAYKVAQGLKTKDLVAKAGIPGTVLHRILNEKVDPRLSTVDAIAKGLGVDSKDMLQ